MEPAARSEDVRDVGRGHAVQCQQQPRGVHPEAAAVDDADRGGRAEHDEREQGDRCGRKRLNHGPEGEDVEWAVDRGAVELVLERVLARQVAVQPVVPQVEPPGGCGRQPAHERCGAESAGPAVLGNAFLWGPLHRPLLWCGLVLGATVTATVTAALFRRAWGTTKARPRQGTGLASL